MTSPTTLKKLLHLPYEQRDQATVVAELCERVMEKRGSRGDERETQLVFTPNPEQLVLALELPEFAAALPQANYLLPDGAGLVWALHRVRPEARFQRLAGVDVLDDILQAAATMAEQSSTTISVLLIGGRDLPGKVDSSLGISVLPLHYRNVMLLWCPGYQDIVHPTAEEEADVLATLKKHHPQMVCVALGAPYQELWLIDHKQQLAQAGVKVGMTVGGAFDMLLGKIQRAPQLVRSLGLEWLYRLVREPWRWRRQLRLIEFVWRVILLEDK